MKEIEATNNGIEQLKSECKCWTVEQQSYGITPYVDMFVLVKGVLCQTEAYGGINSLLHEGLMPEEN